VNLNVNWHMLKNIYEEWRTFVLSFIFWKLDNPTINVVVMPA